MKYLMGLDNGGTEIKCSIYDCNGNEVCSSGARVPMNVTREGHTEKDAEEVFAVNCRVIHEVIESSGIHPDRIIALGITGYGNGLCFVDKTCTAVYPCIVSTDTRAVSYVAKWMADGTAEKIYAATRQSLFASQAPPLIAWFRDNMPEVIDSADYALQIKDYVRAKLTGRIGLEFTDMSNTGLLDIENRCYAESVFRLADILPYRRLFSNELLNSSDLAGYITLDASRRTGLCAGTPVCAGLFDIDACCVASGAFSRDCVCIVGGTWLINQYLSSDLNEGLGKMATTLSFSEGKYLISESSATGTANLEWFLQKFRGSIAPEAQDKELYNICADIIQNEDVRKDAPLFVPYLFSSATGPESKGAFINLSGSDSPYSLLRSVYEGICYSSASHVKKLCIGREKFKKARFLGGAANSKPWCQMLSDVLGIDVEVVQATNPGTLGAAICAGVCCGIYQDFESASNMVTKLKAIYTPSEMAHRVYLSKMSMYDQAVSFVDSLQMG